MSQLEQASLPLLLLSNLLLLASSSSSSLLDGVVFVVLSQPDPHHASVAEETRELLVASLLKAGASTVRVHLAHRDHEVRQHGAWTYFPVAEALSADEEGEDFDWLVFLEEDAGVDAGRLEEVLRGRRPREEEIHLGHALVDEESVVIHHYDPPHVRYAHPSAGIALSARLVALLREKLGDLRTDHTRFPKDFSIDPQYELAKVINHLRDRYDPKAEPPNMVEEDIPLEHVEKFCHRSTDTVGCAVFPRNVTCGPPSEEQVIELAGETLFAVKTCKKFHAERLSVLQDTWETAAPNIALFSEEADPKFGTVVLPGVVNTPRGHCGKTEAILKHFVGEAPGEGWEWLVITDDDTILGVRKVLEQLWCYGGGSRKERPYGGKGVHLGQKYGFRVSSGSYGYDYVTGGGGMVFDRTMAEKIVRAGPAKGCSCPRADTPDDMHLGACLANMGISVVHSPRFHQGRPEDYHPKLTEADHRGGPVSFHKFWNTNPRATYDKFFRESDQFLRDYKYNLKHPRQEL